MDEELGAARTRLEFVGVAALTITLVCLFVGQAAEQFVAQTVSPPIQSAKLKPHFNAIDYATTSSTRAGVVVIGPCDTHSP